MALFQPPNPSERGGGGIAPGSQPDPGSAKGMEAKGPPDGPGEEEKQRFLMRGKGQEKGKTKTQEELAPIRPPHARNVVAIGESTQGGFEGMIATNKVDVPKDKRKYEDVQGDKYAFQAELLELPTK